MFRTYRPEPTSKSQLAKAQKALDSHQQVVSCSKCGATQKTLRAFPFRGSKVYYCIDCVKDAMRKGIDVRNNLVIEEMKNGSEETKEENK